MEKPELNVSFTIGQRQNVRINHVDSFGELVREVTGTKWIKDRQGLWFQWSWKPEMGTDLAGSMDCGFSGVLILESDGSICKTHQHLIAQ
jgi:hypothetical protein